MKQIIINLNKLLLTILAVLCVHFVDAQNMSERASPAAETTGKIGDATITIKYSSPAVKGRQIWGDLVPYDKVWRAGANEATTFETDMDIMVEGNELPAGSYSIYAIPGESEWTIIFNEQTGQWGTVYDEGKDFLRVMVKPKKSKEMQERLAYQVNKDGIALVWENLKVPVSVK